MIYSANYINLIHLGTEIKIMISSGVYINNDSITMKVDLRFIHNYKSFLSISTP